MTKIKKIGLSILGLVFILFLSFILFIHKYTDAYFKGKAEDKINNLLENRYTYSVKESVSNSEINDIKNTTKFIYSKQIKKEIEENYSYILNQAILQTTTKDELNSISKIEEFDKLKNKKLKLLEILNNTKLIKNNKISQDLLKRSQELISKIDKNEQIEVSINNLYNNIDKLTIDQLVNFHSIKKLTKLVDFEKLRKDLDNKVNKLEEKFDKLQKEANLLENTKYNSELEKEKNRSDVYDFEKKNSTLNKISSVEFKARSIIKSTNFKQLLILGYSKVWLFEKNNDSVSGVKEIFSSTGKNRLSNDLRLSKTNPLKGLEKSGDILYLGNIPILTYDSSVSSVFIIENHSNFKDLMDKINKDEVGVVEE